MRDATPAAQHAAAFPAGLIAEDLRELTRLLVTANPTIEKSAGFLGGEYGYGAWCENDVFTMHPYCWCGRDDCPWCWGCTCPEGVTRYLDPDGVEVDSDTFFDSGGYTWGTDLRAPELECDYCRGERVSAANFEHRGSGLRVRWYKYLGRGMQIEVPDSAGDHTWDAVIAECRDWVTKHAAAHSAASRTTD